MKTVAIVSNTAWSLFNYRRNLARTLIAEGYRVVMVAPEDAYSDRLRAEFDYAPVAINPRGTNPVEDSRSTLVLWRLYRNYRVDVALHFTSKPVIYGSVAAKMAGVQSVNNIAGLGTLFVERNLITTLVRQMYRGALAVSAFVFFQNPDDLSLFTSEGLVKAHKCGLLPGSGVQTDLFVPVNTPKVPTFHFLMICRMLWEKGVAEYVEAARTVRASHPEAVFQMVGTFNAPSPKAVSREQMAAWQEEGLIDYLGVTDDIGATIAQADCVVLPSYYREGTPRALLESASMAKPIITTHSVGCKEVVDDGVNGFLVQIKDAVELAERCEAMMALSEAERAEMGAQSRAKAIRQFDERIVIDRYVEKLATLFA